MSRKGQFQNGNIPWNKGKKTGIIGHWKGKHLTNEHRHKLSIAHKGKPGSFTGKKHSLESRAKMSEGIRKAFEEGRLIPWARGRKFTAEHKKHMSEGKKQYYEINDSPLKGRELDKEIVEKQKAGRLKYYENNEVWNKNRKHTITTRKRISQAMKRWWQERKKEAAAIK